MLPKSILPQLKKHIQIDSEEIEKIMQTETKSKQE
jgi:hypothetical protein